MNLKLIKCNDLPDEIYDQFTAIVDEMREYLKQYAHPMAFAALQACLTLHLRDTHKDQRYEVAKQTFNALLLSIEEGIRFQEENET